MLDSLYDSFSTRFKHDNQLSRTGSQEAYDDMVAEFPLLRYALYQATKDPGKLRYELAPDGASALVETTYRGRTFRVFLIREGYWELYVTDPSDPAADPWREADRNVDELFEAQPGGMLLDTGQGKLWSYAPPPRGGIDSLANLRAGYEWKVDDFRIEAAP